MTEEVKEVTLHYRRKSDRDVQWKWLGENGDQVGDTVTTACFLPLCGDRWFHRDARYFSYFPKRIYDTPEDEVYWEFVRKFPCVKTFVGDMTLKEFNKHGLVVDIQKHSGFEMFIAGMMLRYPCEFGHSWVRTHAKLQAQYPKLSGFHIFILTHVYIRGFYNFNHSLIQPTFRRSLDDVTLEEFEARFPKGFTPYYHHKTIFAKAKNGGEILHLSSTMHDLISEVSIKIPPIKEFEGPAYDAEQDDKLPPVSAFFPKTWKDVKPT